MRLAAKDSDESTQAGHCSFGGRSHYDQRLARHSVCCDIEGLSNPKPVILYVDAGLHGSGSVIGAAGDKQPARETCPAAVMHIPYK